MVNKRVFAIEHNNKQPSFNACITSLSDEGRGIAKNTDGKTVFIDGALPNEEITYVIKKKTSKYNEGDTVKVIKAATDRITPRCESFGICGGCSLQHMSHQMQISYKQRVLLSQLKHFGIVEPKTILPPITGPEFAYRHKARLGVRFVAKKNKVLVGFREKRSSFIADIDKCEILHKKIGNSIHQLEELITSLEIFRAIPQIEVAVGDIDTALIFRHLEPISVEDNQKLIDFGKEHNFHIYLQPSGVDSIVKIFPPDNIQRLFYTIPEFDLTMRFHPTDFTQINPEINTQLVSRAIALLDIHETDGILDLFSGLGNFSLPLAKFANLVVGVEGSIAMVDRAYENAKHNGITNVKFYTADLTKTSGKEAWFDSNINKVLIDPPRSGAEEVLPVLAKLNVERIVYVSCNQATLARDSGILVNQYGYKLEQAGILDMFPHTQHVESIAVFIKHL